MERKVNWRVFSQCSNCGFFPESVEMKLLDKMINGFKLQEFGGKVYKLF